LPIFSKFSVEKICLVYKRGIMAVEARQSTLTPDTGKH